MLYAVSLRADILENYLPFPILIQCNSLNEALLFCQDDLEIDLYLFQRHSSIRAIWGNWVLIPPNHR